MQPYRRHDPYGKHDCGSLGIAGERVFWKIDDDSLRWHADERKLKRGGRSIEPQAQQTERLLDLRDDIQNARDLAAASYLASSALGAGSERLALCAVTNAAREALERVLEKLDRAIAPLR